MSNETMVSLSWPNGHVGACRKSMAERLVKKGQAKFLKDVQKETAQKEDLAEAKAKAKAAADKAKKDKADKED